MPNPKKLFQPEVAELYDQKILLKEKYVFIRCHAHFSFTYVNNINWTRFLAAKY